MEPIVGFEGYFVTEDGQVYSAKTGRYLKPWVCGNGHYQVSLSKDGQTYKRFVHTLVAEAFITKPQTDEKLVVHHINGNKLDNNVTNLDWLTDLKHRRIHGEERRNGRKDNSQNNSEATA